MRSALRSRDARRNPTPGAAQAQITDDLIRIGVLTDISGLYADPTGPGSVFAARQAVEDFGAARKGLKVEIIGGDHQNKADVGAAVASRWIDVEKVDVIVDVPTSSVAFAVNEIVKAEEQGLPGLGRRGFGSDRLEMLAQHRSLDL